MALARKCVLLLAICASGSSLAASGAAIPDPQQRIATAQEKFQSVVQHTPEKEVDASAYFTEGKSANEVRNSLANTPVAVRGFFHGATPTGGGGYTLHATETLDDAFANYQREHLHFIKMRLDMTAKMEASETDETARNALAMHRKQAEQSKRDLEIHGLRIIGVELKGKAKAIKDFKEKNPFVRVVELKENGKPQPAILPTK
jgi:hypothetical protein